MRNDQTYDMNTELPYDEMTAADFRIYVARTAYEAQEQYSDLVTRREELTDRERELRMSAMYASGFGWSLVAIIRWVEKTYGPEAGWRAAAMAQDVMTNGGNSFCEDIDAILAEQDSSLTRPNPPAGGAQ